MRSELDGLIRDYIMTHPEIVADAQKALAERRQRDLVRGNHAALFEDPGDVVIGNPKGDVAIVEFFDNECPFCKLFGPTLEKLIAADPNVRVVLKEFAVLGPGSEIAARYAVASKRQGRYLPFHAALLADRTPEHQLAEAHILEIASSVGLDAAQLKQDAQAPEIQQQLDRARALGRTLGIVGTPGLVVGDQVQSGALTFEALQGAVAAARARR